MHGHGTKEHPSRPEGGGRILWAAAWLVQGVLWLCTILLVLHYWFAEVPGVQSFYKQGLEKGFDGLAGVVAAASPNWQDVQRVRGTGGGNRFSRLQGDAVFRVWLERDGAPVWNSGLACLRFKPDGNMEWARRYSKEQAAERFTHAVSGETFTVVPAIPHGDSARQTQNRGAVNAP